MTTALIAATVALLVTVVERLWVAWDERKRWERADKRQVYARFLSAGSTYWLHHLLAHLDPEGARRRMEQFIVGRAEVDLIAPKPVRRAAHEFFDVAVKDEQSTDHNNAVLRLQDEFIDVCREDLGYRG